MPFDNVKAAATAFVQEVENYMKELADKIQNEIETTAPEPVAETVLASPSGTTPVNPANGTETVPENESPNADPPEVIAAAQDDPHDTPNDHA